MLYNKLICYDSGVIYLFMIKDNQKIFNQLHLVLDAIVVAISYLLAWYFKFGAPWAAEIPALSMAEYMVALWVIVPGYIILYYVMNLYTPKRTTLRRYEIFNIFQANTVGLIGFIVVLYIVKQIHFSRTMILMFYIINIVLTTMFRGFIRHVLQFFRKKGYNLKYVLMVGYSRAAEEYINRVNNNPQWGYVIRGILDDHVPAGTLYRGVKVVGCIDNLQYVLPENKLDEITISLALGDYDRLEEIVSMCEKSGVHTKFIPDYNSLFPADPYTEDLLGLSVVNIRYVPLSNPFNRTIKRLFDIIFSLLAIIITSPIMLATVIAIKITSPGPIIFKQERIGLHNKPFEMYKFRSMVVQKAETENKGWTTKDDPRVTSVGKFIRKFSIDELPQFFNVLKGNMSVVGPRPERPQFVDKFKEEIPRYMIKHQVRPGLTGWAQINGYRGDTSIKRRIEHDIYYIENWTLLFDIRIVFLTVFRMFIDKNAY